MPEQNKEMTACMCCGLIICYPPALVCTMCAVTDPEAKVFLAMEADRD